MYDHIATSIPSDINLISSSAMISAHEQFYQQMFGSLADVVSHQHVNNPYSMRFSLNEHHQDYYHQPMISRQHQHQKLRNTKSIATATATCGSSANYSPSLSSSASSDPQQYQFAASRQQLSQSFRANNNCRQQQQQQQQYSHPSRQQSCRQQQQQPCFNNFQPHYLTIEELKTTRNSCWLCGCNWQEDHVSLDCPECDGYALSRPCPSCDGKCKQVWQRNISATHDKHRALWTGQCALEAQQLDAAQTHQDATSSPRDDQDEQIDLNALQLQSQHHHHLLGHAPNVCVHGHADNDHDQDDQDDDNVATSSGHHPTFQLVAPSASSLCSSHPSSAASSDDEPDDFLSI